MDSLLQMDEHKNDRLHLLIGEQIQKMERENLDRLMSSDWFFVERQETNELEQGGGTPEAEIEYQNHLIQAEKNRMKLRLMEAAVFDRGGAAKRIRVEGIEKIISCRIKILESCVFNPRLWCFHKKQLEREKAEYDRITDELNLDVLTTAALDRVKTERKAAGSQNAEDEAGMIREFLDTDFSERALRADYVIQNLGICLHNVEMIRRMEEMRLAQHEEPKPEIYIFMERKLESVREYTNAVESVLWEYGMTIDYTALQVRKIDEGDEDFAARRQAYQKNGALRFALGARKYRRAGKGVGGIGRAKRAVWWETMPTQS